MLPYDRVANWLPLVGLALLCQLISLMKLSRPNMMSIINFNECASVGSQWEIYTPGGFQHPMEFQQTDGHHHQVGHCAITACRPCGQDNIVEARVLRP